MIISNRYYAGYKTCYRLLDELNNLINKSRPKADFQDVARRLFIIVATCFLRDERSYAKFDYFDALSRREIHSKILAKFLRLSDELDKATLPEDWIKCASFMLRELTKDLKDIQQTQAAVA